MNINPVWLGQVLASYTNAVRIDAPASVDKAVFFLLNQLTEGQATMALDLSKLAAELPQAIAALQQLPQVQSQLAAAQAANADLSAKLAAAPHDDPTVQASVDQMATSLQAALDGLSAVSTAAGTDAPASAAPSPVAPVVDTPVATDPAPTPAVPPADTTATPAPVTTAPADPAAPTGTETPL